MAHNDRRGTWTLAIVLLVLNLMIGLWPVDEPSVAQEPKIFVYKVIEVQGDTQAIQTALTEYGGSGWELVTVAMTELEAPRLIFKK